MMPDARGQEDLARCGFKALDGHPSGPVFTEMTGFFLMTTDLCCGGWVIHNSRCGPHCPHALDSTSLQQGHGAPTVVDPSTVLQPRSEERRKKSRPGSVLTMPHAEARGSRRVDYKAGHLITSKKNLRG